ncbi:MAG: GGDEF domain-containing protein [Gemmatimonadales bacterium]|nr:GGDEF domain-containing protein [Gemmatimonadales bacterium]
MRGQDLIVDPPPHEATLGPLRAFDEFLTRTPQRAIVAGALVLIVAIGVIDYLAGPEFVSIHPLYFAPIAITAWYIGVRAAIALSLAAAGVWLLADSMSNSGVSHEVIPFLNTIVSLGAFILIGALLAMIRRHLAREEQLAATDPLTGLANSRAFYEEVDRELQRAGRYQHPFSVCAVDLDNFKAINDTHGHLVGDQVLTHVAQTLRTHTRSTDTVARLGGDEFVILFPETDAASAREVLETVRRRLVEAMSQHGWQVTFSIGGVTFDTPAPSVQSVIKAADDLMYEVKRAEKDAWMHEVYPGAARSAAVLH